MPNWDEFQDPFELASALWEYLWSSRRAANLSPDDFRALFARIYNDCQDIPTLWQLGGATNDYLRTYPGAIEVPVELIDSLRASDHMDARIIGLKLLKHSKLDDQRIVSEIVRALQQPEDYEYYGGFVEMRHFLDRHRVEGRAIATPLVDELRRGLARFFTHEDEYSRTTAHALTEYLDEFQAAAS